ncbi:hypothetical protein ACS0TY_001640 [Phlomoides rotata]
MFKLGRFMCDSLISMLSRKMEISGEVAGTAGCRLLARKLTCGLVDLGFVGHKYTWWNKQSGNNNIQERLDRGVATTEWISRFSRVKVNHLPRLLSDHYLIWIVWSSKKRTGGGHKFKKLFRFEAFWLQEERCADIVFVLGYGKKVRKLIVEVESHIVFYALNQPRMDLSYFGRTIAEDCKCFDEVSFSWVRRNANSVAHSLVQFVFSCDEPFNSTSMSDEIAYVVNVDADLRHV